tara:strand:- start:83 stop:481 length:399 start_codon:yes stop_codon:yes gene_type:complete
MKFILIILTLLLFSCDDNPLIDFRFLDIYLQDEIDENGYYHIEYGNSYHHVYTFTEPYERIKWGTNSYFYVEDWMGNLYEEPIIQYSIYADEYGNGQQIFALYDAEPGDTLMIYGYINFTIYDYLYLIIDEE